MVSGSTNETNARSIAIEDTPEGFNPDIPGAGLVVNYDASILSSIIKSTNGTTVVSWTDQKNGLVATSQNNTTTYQLNGVKFDGADYLSIPVFAGLNLSTAMSIFVVATVDDVVGNPTGHFICHSSGAAGYQFRYTNTPDGDARFNLAGVTDQNAGVTSWESGLRASIGVVYQGGAGMEYQKNGSQLASSKVAANGNPISLETRIGATSSGGEFLAGTINQILIYNTKLAGADLAAVNEGLLSKWSS